MEFDLCDNIYGKRSNYYLLVWLNLPIAWICHTPCLQISVQLPLSLTLADMEFTLCTFILIEDIPLCFNTRNKTVYSIKNPTTSYVYWTVHHCDNWRIKDQLDVTYYFISFYFLCAKHVSDINISIVTFLTFYPMFFFANFTIYSNSLLFRKHLTFRLLKNWS